MDTITINANDANSQEGKKKGIDPNTIAAATTTAAAGIALGATISSLADDITEDLPAEEVVTHQSPIDSDPVVEDVPEESIIAQVNPDEVMLEEPTDEDTSASEPETPQQPAEDEYQPFASNDVIADDVIADEVLIADNPSEDMIADDPTVDMICGIEDNQSTDVLESETPADENLLADVDATSVDIQTDLMA